MDLGLDLGLGLDNDNDDINIVPPVCHGPLNKVTVARHSGH